MQLQRLLQSERVKQWLINTVLDGYNFFSSEHPEDRNISAPMKLIRFNVRPSSFFTERLINA